MNWIKEILHHFTHPKVSGKSDEQQKLILLVCLPCFSVSIAALFIAGISGYLIAFIIIILLMICSYAAVASKQNSEYQIRTLSNLIESMIAGDYSLRGRVQTNQAFQELLTLINHLANTLAKHKIEAKESRLLLERIMEQMDAMVLATNEQGIVVMANASANKFILGDVDILSDLQLSSIPAGQKIVDADLGIIEFDQGILSGEHFLSKESFISEGTKHKLYMLTNAERLLMEKERKAWQGLLRVLSHEMNNSLTPISAISQSMQKKLQRTDIVLDKSTLLEGVNIIHERADSLSGFIASYSQLSHLPKPNKLVFEFNQTAEKLATLFPAGKIHFSDTCDVLIEADKSQFEQVLINLFKNSIEAMVNVDEKIMHVSAWQDDKWQYISIADQGSGIANSDNLFVPFYSTKTQGSGIGLALCRQIMFNHNGQIKLSNREDGPGAKALLSLPRHV